MSATAGVAIGDRVSVGATFADYDNDGFADLFVTSTRGGNVLFHNRGDGTFANVTAAAGVSHVGHSQTPVFFDYDDDGDLDLFLTNTAHWTKDVVDFANGNYYEGKESLADLMMSPKETNILYRNNGDGSFTDVTAATLVRTPHGAIGSKVFDYDGDGRLDLFVVDMHSDMWTGIDSQERSREAAKQYQTRRFLTSSGPTVDESVPGFIESQRNEFAKHGEDYDAMLFGNALYRNLGGGKFTETAVAAGLETFWPWGIATGDYDNDGDEDVFITAGMGYPFYYWPNSLMMNNGDGTFRDRAATLGVEPPAGGSHLATTISGRQAARSSRSAAVADFDGDGRLEIVTNNFNDRPYLFANRFPRRNYVALRLTGTKSNRDAIGALARLWAGNTVMVRQVNPAGGYLAQSSKVLHFGLGDRTSVDSIEIRWPRGTVQTVKNPAIDTLHQIREPTQ